jgi:prepilin-type N-terminal cleavage/methylation domain-containing protein
MNRKFAFAFGLARKVCKSRSNSCMTASACPAVKPSFPTIFNRNLEDRGLRPNPERPAAFTLIELLVVIAIVGILASLLFPVLSRAKQQTAKVKCLSNLRQIGFGLEHYTDENGGRFPPTDGSQLIPQDGYQYGDFLGGNDAAGSNNVAWVPPATNRLLNPYIKAREVWRCPADGGFRSPLPGVYGFFNPTTFDCLGLSYRFNGYLPNGYYQTSGVAQDPAYNLGLKRESWVPEPSRFIIIHEAGVYPWSFSGGNDVEITHWHRASSPGKVFTDRTIVSDPDRVVSPVLFVDGHSQQCDFTDVIKGNPFRGLEPGKDWMWYKRAH